MTKIHECIPRIIIFSVPTISTKIFPCFNMHGSQNGSVMSDSLWPHGLYSPWNSSGQNTGVGRLSLLQGISPTQGSNPGLPHCRQILYQLSHKGSPRILEWVAYRFSSGSSQPRNQTGVPCIAGRFFANRAIRESLKWKWKSLSGVWLLGNPWTVSVSSVQFSRSVVSNSLRPHESLSFSYF